MAEDFGTITTGVDRLVSLVGEKKSISVNDAAKVLDVPRHLIEEWADFLEEKGIIEVQFKLTTAYLVSRQISRADIKKRVNAFSSEQKNFSDKVDSALTLMDREAKRFQELRAGFHTLSSELEEDIRTIQKDIKTLHNLDQEKRNAKKELSSLQQKFSYDMDQLHQKLLANREKFRELSGQIGAERETLKKELAEQASLVKTEALLQKKLDAVKAQVERFRNKVDSKGSLLDEDKDKIARLGRLADEVEARIIDHQKNIEPLARAYSEKNSLLQERQKAFLDEISGKHDRVRASSTKESQDIRKKFELMFRKKVNADLIMDSINREVNELHNEFVKLSREAKAVSLMSKSPVKDQMARLEKRFGSLDKRRKKFESNVLALSDMFKK